MWTLYTKTHTNKRIGCTHCSAAQSIELHAYNQISIKYAGTTRNREREGEWRTFTCTKFCSVENLYFVDFPTIFSTSKYFLLPEKFLECLRVNVKISHWVFIEFIRLLFQFNCVIWIFWCLDYMLAFWLAVCIYLFVYFLFCLLLSSQTIKRWNGSHRAVRFVYEAHTNRDSIYRSTIQHISLARW